MSSEKIHGRGQQLRGTSNAYIHIKHMNNTHLCLVSTQ